MSQKFTYRKCGNDWWESCHRRGPGITPPSTSGSKSCLTFSTSCLSNFSTQEFWSESLLLKVIPLWSKCERKIWSAHKVKHIMLGWALNSQYPGELLQHRAFKHVLVCLNKHAWFFMCTNMDLPHYTPLIQLSELIVKQSRRLKKLLEKDTERKTTVGGMIDSKNSKLPVTCLLSKGNKINLPRTSNAK